ncbi:hypothetical protein SAMN05421678_12333 [Actinopolymorpha cephalotaxi]|uniref:Uncharacterized protein n=1 Tax=Actinopolymorpha cephalotaxi TaxID=504797 RepID=A0A1I3BAV3_9ACTN|nr:hypothetical protein [Actinopolymorpha cephalotaxi]SFH59418.1 hypothetical protein SAMN05421678_12333 [Actinopolymorpha cephalotaxi]
MLRLTVAACLLLGLSSCFMADPMPPQIGVARGPDGLEVHAGTCSDDSLESVRVYLGDSDTSRLLWSGVRPETASAKRGTVLLGNSAAFGRAKGSMQASNDQLISIEVDSRLSTTGTAFRPDKIPLTRKAGTFWVYPWKRAYSAAAIDRQSGCR